MKQNISFFQRLTYAVIIIVFGFLILTKAKHILQPIALSLLLSYLLFPIVNFLEKKWKFNRSLAILLSLLFGLSILFGIIELLIIQIKVVIRDFAVIKHQGIQNIRAWQLFIEHKFHFTANQQDVWLQKQIAKLLDKSNKILSTLVKTSFSTIETIVFIPIYTFFMLLYRNRGRQFILKTSNLKNNLLTNELLDEISKVTTKYIIGLSTVVLILAISHSIALLSFGLKYAIPIALMTALMSFIPYFGTLISGVIPLGFSLLLSSNQYTPLLIIVYFIVITFIDHNILTPTITGGNVSLNPLATIVGLLFASFIWGVTGMIIVVPLLATIKTICDKIPGLEPYGYLIGIESHGIDFRNLIKKIKNKFKKID